MRDVQKNEELLIPEGVTVAIKSRVVVVEGPRGKLEKSIKHINMDLRLVSPKAEGRQSKVTLVVWHGARKHVACLRTVKSMIQNMITGVTKGFRYKLKAVYAHFPVNIIINDGGKSVEIRNFLGEKVRASFRKACAGGAGATPCLGRGVLSSCCPLR
jgi:large subunit ribosomal protein L9e